MKRPSPKTDSQLLSSLKVLSSILKDDGSVLADHLQQLRRGVSTWHEVSEAGYLLAGRMNLARQVDQIRELIGALAAA